ncbi:MAG: cytidine deaminase [Clostridia bacterium]|jgi:cytidine deaminase|nr:cytidine deaminase [Clostridia bacterium]MDN5321778.1 cytidine deaminase [Clostridia bacterium]
MVSYEELVQIAAEAKKKAYVPYSQFRVGAAILSEDGLIFSGCNIENASYGLTNCGERTALFKAVSEGVRKFKAIAISTDTEEITSPCGPCRQVLLEFGEDIEVIMANVHGDYKICKVKDLLPLAFSPAKLEEERLS